MIMKVGRVCRKTRGKEAGRYCVIVERVDNNLVVVDGRDVERGKVNLKHLEPLPSVVDIDEGAKTQKVVKKLEKEGF